MTGSQYRGLSAALLLQAHLLPLPKATTVPFASSCQGQAVPGGRRSMQWLEGGSPEALR